MSHAKIGHMRRIKPKLVWFMMAVLILCALLWSIFLYFAPKMNQAPAFSQLNEKAVDYRDLLNDLSSTPKAYFFCTIDNVDCLYTNQEVIDFLITSANTQRFDQITFVDMVSIDAGILPSALKSHVGFSHYPAFAMLSKSGKDIVVHSVYEWTDEAIFTPVGLKQWMVENALWRPDYTN